MTEVPELVVDLPGLLLSCIENLEAVELGQKYDQEYDLAKLRIQTTTLSLANWGQSFGIQADMQETPEVADVTQLLKSIKQRLEQACAASEKFKPATTMWEKSSIVHYHPRSNMYLRRYANGSTNAMCSWKDLSRSQACRDTEEDS